MSHTFTPDKTPDALPPLNPLARPARWATSALAIFGCAMIYLVGKWLVGPLTGLAAAALLAASPLYGRHARLVMNDCPTQAFLLAGFAAFLFVVKGKGGELRPWMYVATVLACGLMWGFAAATKLNGAEGPMAALLLALLATIMLFALRPAGASSTAKRLWLVLLPALGISVATAWLLNPYFFAQPELPAAPPGVATVQFEGETRPIAWLLEIKRMAAMSTVERARYLLEHRRQTLAASVRIFPHLAITSPAERLKKVVTDGLGRWSAAGRLGDQVAYCGLIAFALVLLGIWRALRHGLEQLRSGVLPMAWLLVVWPAIEVVALLDNLAIDFDRYYMGVVVWTSLLVPYGIARTGIEIMNRLVLPPPERAEAT